METSETVVIRVEVPDPKRPAWIWERPNAMPERQLLLKHDRWLMNNQPVAYMKAVRTSSGYFRLKERTRARW